MMRMSDCVSSNPQLNLGDGRLNIDSPPTLRGEELASCERSVLLFLFTHVK
jgi:hypothetical protein